MHEDVCARPDPAGAAAGSAKADVKTRDKSQVKFEGMLGRMVGMFGGKAAKDGVVTTEAVKGDRKVEMNDTTAASSISRKRRSTSST